MRILRAFTATSAICLAVSACDSPGVTDPRVRSSPAPALDGIGMVGGGGRSAEGDGTPAVSPGDSATAVAPPK